MRETPVRRPILLGLFGLVLSVSVACRVDRAQFDQRIFACDTAAPDPACGTDAAGRAMACFASRQIGATDFCTKQCDDQTPTEPDGVCLSSGISNLPGIELRSCQPSADADAVNHPLGACDQRGLACYRTDMLSDEGVCTTLSPCDVDGDCHDPVRSVCATTFLAGLYAATDLQRDHLYCLQTGCKSRGTSCSPGNTCLQEVIPPSAHPPDICVPNCDSALRCPPNFLCYKKVSTSVAPSVCIPGLLGFTCDSAIDCMFGQCVDTGVGYKVCTTDCKDTGVNDDCARFDGEQGKFTCVKNPADPGTPGKCQTPDAYRGSVCVTTDDCLKRNDKEICSRFNPGDQTGTCLLPCTPDADPKVTGSCLERAGINHTCLTFQNEPALVKDPNFTPICFPGYFGLTCESDSNCVGDLSCEPLQPGGHMCTRSCSKDDDCHNNRWISTDGWCAAPLGLPVCLPNNSMGPGDPCMADIACQSGTTCNTTSHTCVSPSAGASP